MVSQFYQNIGSLPLNGFESKPQDFYCNNFLPNAAAPFTQSSRSLLQGTNQSHHLYDYSQEPITTSINTAKDVMCATLAANSNSANSGVLEVYAYNLYEGSKFIKELLKVSSIVAIDTEFPGVVVKVSGEYDDIIMQSYHNIKVNVDVLKPIQIGFSFFTLEGQHPFPVSTVQFNLKWNRETDSYSQDSIDLLEKSGIDFGKLKTDGIEVPDFIEMLLVSGLPLNDEIEWIGFHSAYDWAYMLQMCHAWEEMPDNYPDFMALLSLYFPKTKDLKVIQCELGLPRSGLQDLADSLSVSRVGCQHQAGSDSKLTGEVYFQFLKAYHETNVTDCTNLIYGLNYSPSTASTGLWLPNKNSSTPIQEDESTSDTASTPASDNAARDSSSGCSVESGLEVDANVSQVECEDGNNSPVNRSACHSE